MTQRTMPSGLTATAFERLVLNSTAQSLNSTTRAAGGSVLRISVETQDARFREDGGDPTNTTGIVLQADVLYELTGYNGTSTLKFVKATGGTSVLNVGRYSHV